MLINKINYLTNSHKASFDGHHLSQNDYGEKVYKFYIPKVNYEKASVVLRKLEVDENGNVVTQTATSPIEREIPRNTAQIEINPKAIGLSSSEVLAYHFVIDGKEYTDQHRNVFIGSKKYNLADVLSGDVLQTPKTMYHLMPGTFNPKLKSKTYTNALGEKVVSDDKTAQMNHFMKFDTGIDDIIKKIPHIKEMGFRRVLSTPIFGDDNISNAGYWTSNPFHVTSRYGTIKDFERLQIELFKNSLGLVADGAFTAEGLSGIHFRDILRNGEKSPFYRWFDLKGNLKLGVLPDNNKAYENYDIRIVNSPVIWETDANGRPTGNFGKKNPKYDATKESFIQLYDKRLTSKEQLASEDLIVNYDIRNTKIRDDIKGWKDSVYPYAFPVTSEEIIKKASKAKKYRTTPAKEALKDWENFTLTPAKESAGLSLWQGNKDMAKLKFAFPEYKRKEILATLGRKDGLVEVEKSIQAAQDVQDYVVSIGKYWTNKTAKTLREYIAKELASAGTSASSFKRLIDSKAGKTLPAELKHLTVGQIQNALNGEYKATRTLSAPKTIEKALLEYPLEALEVSDDLLSILARPTFKRKISVLYQSVMPEITTQILKKLNTEDLPCGKLLNDGELRAGQEKILQLLTDDIAKALLLKGLNQAVDINTVLLGTSKNLKTINAKDLCGETKNVEEQENQLLINMFLNIKTLSNKEIDTIVNHLKSKIGKMTPESIKVADLIIDKTEAGLNWRYDAAKDVADIEAFSAGITGADEAWGLVADFWKKFNNGVRLYNAHSYKIGEFTDTAISNTEASKRFPNAGQIESKIIEESGLTTQTNYSYIFDAVQRFFAAPAERNSGANTNALDLIFNKFEKGWNGVPGYLYSGNKNNIVFSHAAAGNHDKQRISQTFSMNMPLAFINEIEFVNQYPNNAYWKNIGDGIHSDLLASNLGYSEYYKDITSYDWKSLFRKVSPQNLAKVAAYNDAFAKATKGQNIDLQKAFSKALDTLSSKKAPRSDFFFYKNFENTLEDILAMLPQKQKKEVESLKAKIHKELTKPAQIRGVELAKLMVALPANPTIFAGDELLELGGEEKSKNYSVQNRNRLHWENLDYTHVEEYADKLSEIFNLRNDKNLTSLVNGDTILLKNQGNIGSRNVLGMYRYNDKDDCIILMHNAGFNSGRNFKQIKDVSIPNVDLSNGTVNYAPDGSFVKTEKANVGLPIGCEIKAGTKYVNALNKKEVYVIGKDGNLYGANRKPITLTESVTILKRA